MTSQELTTRQKHRIIELLTEIRDDIREIKEEYQEKVDYNKETYTCDWCEDEEDGKPYRKINKYVFCSHNCWKDWENDLSDN